MSRDWWRQHSRRLVRSRTRPSTTSSNCCPGKAIRHYGENVKSNIPEAVTDLANNQFASAKESATTAATNAQWCEDQFTGSSPETSQNKAAQDTAVLAAGNPRNAGIITPAYRVQEASEEVHPASEKELVKVVEEGAKSQRKMKVATQYSHSRPKLVCPDGRDSRLICTDKLNRLWRPIEQMAVFKHGTPRIRERMGISLY
ncbi:hypothetical protein MLD38_036007 [Melastoma candidum]|uniref:Uncharacterized protein n=1 Tax=Melastoma candidum TaxID=119954 RepID=A0ACB9LIK0_9MYRT|nr:hypothetical protein MLD38_036007 [Melastoma candidum]